MALTGRQFPIQAGEHTATVVEVGGGLRVYDVAGEAVFRSFGEDVLPPKAAGISLVPWPNRIRDGRYSFDGAEYQLALTEPAQHNAIHGLGRFERWDAVEHEASRVTLALDIVPQTGWPFEVRAEVTYSLDAELGLTVELRAHNHGTTRVPFGAGSHPYLATRGSALDDVTLTIPARTRLQLDAAQIPVGSDSVAGTDVDFRTGKRLGGARFDDAFADLDVVDGRGVAEVRVGEHGARLWFEDAFRYLQVFTVDSLVDGHAGIAIEPMTCPADAFNSGDGLIVLEPDQSWSARWGIQPF